MRETVTTELLHARVYDVGVIGAGPAGLAAAIFCGGLGRSVLLIDRMAEPGRKLLATGGGRCNVTNASEKSAMCAAFGHAARFVRPAITSFCNSDLLAFLAALGVECAAADGFHYYPRSESARDVLDALLEACRASGVTILTGCRVTAIEAEAGRVVALHTDKGRIPVRAAVLATGGRSYPALGSDGSGYALVEALGGRVIAPVPALAGLKVKERWVRALSGVAVPDVVLSVPVSGAKAVRTRGELLFTHDGLSGPAALDASSVIARALLDKADIEVRIDFAPGVARDVMESAIVAAGAASGTRLVRTEVARYVPASLAQKLCGLEQKWGQAPVSPEATGRQNSCQERRQADMGTGTCFPAGARIFDRGHREGNSCQSPSLPETRLAALTARARRAVLDAVKECRVRVTGTDGFSDAMVTSGGVDRAEVSARTLESTRVKGLFFAGEVVDVDGPCGGYNLQWAFSSGRLAGLSAAERADRPD